MPGGDMVLENGIHTVGFQLGVLGILDQHLKMWVWDRFEHIEDTLSVVEPSVPDQSPSDTGAVLLNNSADYLASKAGWQSRHRGCCQLGILRQDGAYL